VYRDGVPTDDEITFADHMGRFYARRYGFPPMVGRLVGYLAVCEPREQSIGELAESLLASRSAISGAIKTLESIHYVRRTRAAGERMDRVRLDLSSQARGFDVSEYEELGELAREGLKVVGENAPAPRRAVLAEIAAFADFLVERIPQLRQEWDTHREELCAAGELPAEPERRIHHRDGDRS
jgi:DNA-binding MarR family transcriptional regulator